MSVKNKQEVVLCGIMGATKYVFALALLETTQGVSQSRRRRSTMRHYTTPRSFLVYKITNLVTGKLYIGITSRTLTVRWNQHKRDAKTSDFLIHRSMMKHGFANFAIEVIETCIDQETMLRQEQYWIKHYNSQAPNGYNITAGGEGLSGYHHTEETRQKLSQKSITPEFRARMRAIALERAKDPEYRRQLSESRKGQKLSPAQIEQIKSSRQKQVFSRESIEKRNAKNRGQKRSLASIAKMQQAQKGRTFTQESRQKIAQTLSKLTDEQAAIVKFNAYGLSQREYAALFGVSPQMINGLVKGRTYTHVTMNNLPLEAKEQMLFFDEEEA